MREVGGGGALGSEGCHAEGFGASGELYAYGTEADDTHGLAGQLAAHSFSGVGIPVALGDGPVGWKDALGKGDGQGEGQFCHGDGVGPCHVGQLDVPSAEGVEGESEVGAYKGAVGYAGVEGLDQPDIGGIVDHLLGDEAADDGVGVGGDGEKVFQVVGPRCNDPTGVGDVAVKLFKFLLVDGPGQDYGEHG